MPDMECFEIGLDDIIMDQFEKGKLLKVWKPEKEREDTVHYAVKHAREVVAEIYKLYSRKKKPTRKDFVKVWDKNRDERDKEINNFLDQLDRPAELLRVESKKETKDKVVITLKKVDDKERLKIVQSIAKKLAKKLDKKTIQSLLEEGVRKEKNIDRLKKIDNNLEEKEIEVKGHKGCFTLTIGEEELMIIQ